MSHFLDHIGSVGIQLNFRPETLKKREIRLPRLQMLYPQVLLHQFILSCIIIIPYTIIMFKSTRVDVKTCQRRVIGRPIIMKLCTHVGRNTEKDIEKNLPPRKMVLFSPRKVIIDKIYYNTIRTKLWTKSSTAYICFRNCVFAIATTT